MTHENYDVAILLPAFNEELTIAEVIAAFHNIMPSARIYVIDNNSSDGTAAIAKKILAQIKTGALLHELHHGKGNALRRAFLEIDADIFVIADADMTYPPEKIHELVAPIAEGLADMVIGDRLSEGGQENFRKFHTFGNNLVRTLINMLFGAKLSDIMTGYRAFNRPFARSYPFLAAGFQIETDMTIFALRHRFRILEIPIRCRNRPEGSFSKLNTFSDGLRVLLTIFNLLRHGKPFVFFSFIAVCAACLGLLAGFPVIWEFVNTGFIRHVPLAILASALEMVAVTIFGVGLTLDSVARQNDIDTERIIQAYSTAPQIIRQDQQAVDNGGD